MRGHTRWVNGVTHFPDGRRIITCSSDGSLRLWDLKSGTQIGEDWRDENPGVWSMALSPNGEIVASGCDDGKVRLWDVETRKVMGKLTGHTKVVFALCWSADGERVASGSGDGTATIWDVKRRENILTIKTGHTWVRATMRGHTDWVNGVAHLPDGRRIITCSSDGSLRLWDLKSGTQIGEDWRDENLGIFSMALSPNGEIVASGCGYGKLRLWDVETRKVMGKCMGHITIVSALCWSADGERVASGYWDGIARVWD
ncbi:hypothetical protein CY34DRAFT_99201, partial [Suillus luteus UH-Slu-Lm8-n1]